MSPHVNASLADQLALADLLLAGKQTMLEPQDLPGRYGKAVHAIDRLLIAMDCPSVVGGGWAVWRHGFVNRVTQDIDIVLPADRIAEFLRAASVAGFHVLKQAPGRWPKLEHKETRIQVDILPEGERPGSPPDFAPTTIPSPTALGAKASLLSYVPLPGLIELKLAAGRRKDHADVLELIRYNRTSVEAIRDHLANAHPQYVDQFDRLASESEQDESR